MNRPAASSPRPVARPSGIRYASAIPDRLRIGEDRSAFAKLARLLGPPVAVASLTFFSFPLGTPFYVGMGLAGFLTLFALPAAFASHLSFEFSADRVVIKGLKEGAIEHRPLEVIGAEMAALERLETGLILRMQPGKGRSLILPRAGFTDARWQVVCDRLKKLVEAEPGGPAEVPGDPEDGGGV